MYTFECDGGDGPNCLWATAIEEKMCGVKTEIDQSEQVLCEFSQLKDQLLNCKLSQIGLDLLCPSNLDVI